MRYQPRPLVAIAAAAALVGGVTLTACNDTGPACPSGQVAEYDDDGWECEPDEDGDGLDDEGSDSSSWWKKSSSNKSWKKSSTGRRR